MNEHEDFKMYSAVMRDPEFALRILRIRQALLYIFLAVGIAGTFFMTLGVLSGDGHAGHILVIACWPTLVMLLLKNGRLKIKNIQSDSNNSGLD